MMAGVDCTLGKELERHGSPRWVHLRKPPQTKLPLADLPETISLLEEAHRSKLDESEIPSRLGCSKLRPGNLREENPAKKMHGLAICEDQSESAVPFPEPEGSSIRDSVHPDKVTQTHTEHSRPDPNRRPQECPATPPHDRVGACGEEKLLPGAPIEHIRHEDPRPTTPPGGPPKPSQHGGGIHRCIELAGWLTGADAWQKVASPTKDKLKST